MEEKQELMTLALNFYADLFRSDPTTGGEFIKGRFPQISEEAHLSLEAELSIDETRRALMEIGSLKALGPDGYQPVFFKCTWDLTRRLSILSRSGFLMGGEVPAAALEALLVLIPKEDKPTTIRSFRQISLCNVCIRVVIKIIVNRLKAVLRDIITPNPASFIPGRQSTDNIIIC